MNRDVALVLIGTWLTFAPAAARPVPSDLALLVDRIRAAAPDLSHPLDPAGLRLTTGFATLELDRGVLFPVRTEDGRAIEMVFIGRGQVRLEAPDEIEADQLELFTGSPRLEETFTEAVFVIARDSAAEALLQRPVAEPTDIETLRRAEERYAQWKDSPERRTLAVETGILLDALNDPLYEEYFAGWFLGESLGPFLFQVDPAAEEQIRLGQFVRFEVSPERQQNLSRFLHQQQKRGRLMGLELETLGRWDSWVHSPFYSPEGEPRPGSAGFEPTHYEINVDVDPRSGQLVSRSRVRMRALGSGRRVVHLELHGDLEITRLKSSDGQSLFFLRESGDVQVLLPRVPERGEEVILELSCEGGFFESGDEQDWALRSPLGWYPRTGSNERATYDVTLRWPRRLQLVASGHRVDGGESDGQLWERRRMDFPTLGFSFEVGRFEIESIMAGRVKLNIALDPNTRATAPEGSLQNLLSTGADVLSYFENIFGAYPLEELTLVTVPRQYSQAMLGFITLSGRVVADWGVFGPLLRVPDRGSVVAHEVAHQWWGHLVGWRSYRDQWVSEAMANYAALLWVRHRGLKPEVGPITGWQQELTATIADGRPIESLGPLVLGERLYSSRSQDAYQAIVYRKGALVLEMLARKLGEDTFQRALKILVGAAAGRVISTTDFLALLERITHSDLDSFAQQFIFGTGLPEIYYDYSFEPTATGRYKIRIEAQQELPSRYRYGIVTMADGRLDVGRRRVERRLDVDRSELMVPIQISLAEDRDETARAAGQSTTASRGRQRMLHGRLTITGRHSELEIEIDHEPRRLWLDRDHQIFARFLDRRRHPKRMLLKQATQEKGTGELAAAEETLRRALVKRSPLASTDHLLDAHLHIQLAGVLLDGGRDAEATASLERARQALERGAEKLPRSEARRFESALEVSAARLETRRGDYQAAFARLHHGVLDPHDATSTEGYLLLAIAAFETGRQAELEDSLQVVRQRGVDVSRLSPAPVRTSPPDSL